MPQSEWIVEWNQVSRLIRRQLVEWYVGAGLSESRAAVLLALADPRQGFTQSELARDLGVSESNLCDLIERMRVEGLIDRQRSLLDRRKSILTLTDSGRKRCDEIADLHRDFESAVARHFTPEQREYFSTWTHQVHSLLKPLSEPPSQDSWRAA